MNPFAPPNWLALCDCELCHQVHRAWCIGYRMPAVDAMTAELGTSVIALLVNHRKALFENMVAGLVVAAVARN